VKITLQFYQIILIVLLNLNKQIGSILIIL